MKLGNLLAIIVISLMMHSSLSHAAVTIDVSEVGGDVVASANGTINTTSLSSITNTLGFNGLVNGSTGDSFLNGEIGVGPGLNLPVTHYQVTTTAVFSTGFKVPASTNSGDYISVISANSFADRIIIPRTYVSGNSISATSTWTGKTIADLGLVPGTYTFTWGFNTTADSVTLNIGIAPPSTYSVSGVVGGPVGATMRLRQADDHTVFATVVSGSGGNYTFSGLANGDYTIQPSIFGYEYTPGVTAVTISGADVTGIDFTAQINQPGNRIYGTVTGSGAVGATITLGTTPEETTLTDSTGYYIFLDVPNGTYPLTPSLTGFTFDSPSYSATVNDYDRHVPNFVSSMGVSSPQTITNFTATPSSGAVGGSSTLSATASSGLIVTFGSDTPAVCTVAGSTVSYLIEGACIVTADQAGDSSFDPAPQVTLDIIVTKTDQTITDLVATPPTGAVAGTSALSATASSGLAVSFGSSTPAICTVSGSTVTYLAVGTCTVTADQAGDATYNPATQVTLDIGVGLTDQVITNFVATPSTGGVNGSSTLSATGGASGNPVVFGSNTLAVCTVAGSTVTYVTAGTCTVTADQAGDASFNAAPTVTLDITVAKADQTITGFAANPATGVAGGTSALSATADSGLAVAFGSSTSAVCTVAGSTVTYVTTGTCTVTADQAGDADYNAAPQVTLDITVAKADQTITGLTADPATGVVEGSSALSATADSGLTVSFGSSTAAVCTVTGTTVNYLAAGTCTITADQAGDAAYNAATQVTLDISVAKADQTISGLTADPASGVIGGTSTLSVSSVASVASVAHVAQSGQKRPTTKASGIPVIYGSNTLTICTVAGSTVSYLAIGICTVTADQAGDANYNPAPQVTLDINVAAPPPAVIPNVPIPTLSLWGLVAMFLMMLGIGGMVVRRKT